MALVLVGINHNTATIDLREKVAFPPETITDAISKLTNLNGVEEAVIVSTCNRTEVYLDMEDAEGSVINDTDLKASNRRLIDRQKQVVAWLADFHALPEQQLLDCSYSFGDEDVLRHLMKVSCGLDSMVLGEPQILGQIKSAYAVSHQHNAVGANLGRAFQESFSIAKEVRTDTAIGENPVSVAYAAVSLSEQIFSDLTSLSVLLIGAGKTIELVARHLLEKGVKNMVLANRTLENALDLGGKIGAHAVLLSDIPEQLVHADIVVSSTNSQLPLLGKGAVERALKQRRHKPMLLVDLAVPRDIEVEVGELADAYLYSVDDISDVIDDNVRSRAEAASQAESIIERGVQQYQRQLRSLNAVGTLKAFRKQAEQLSSKELARSLKALEKGEPAAAVLEGLARALTNKLIHSPSVQMKKASADGRNEILQLIQELYQLDFGQGGDDSSVDNDDNEDSS